jgi:hypothetical protein
LAEITRRYFTGHGPATLKDFMWWSGLNLAEVKRGVQLAGDALQEVAIDDATYYMRKGAQPAQGGLNEAFMLPTYDEYLIGYKDRSAAVAKEHYDVHIAAPNMVFGSAIIYQGKGIAMWKRKLKKDVVLISIKQFSKLSPSEGKAIKKAVDRYGEFLGLPVQYEIN